MKCPYCGSEKIEEGIAWGKGGQAGNVGLKYSVGFVACVTQVYSDLCLDCGGILKMYIKDTAGKKWNKKPGSLGSR